MTAARKLSTQEHFLSLMPQNTNWSSLFDQFGWAELPTELKQVVNGDLLAFEQELNGYYSYTGPALKSRRKNVRFWVESFLNNEVTLETAVQALIIKF